MCFSACHWARIERVVFGARISDAARSGFNELHVSNEELKSLGGTSMAIAGGCLESDCRDLFRQFLEQERATTY
jgi:tRNA(Arg) A34 adenosine deaminase TadA